MAIVDALIQILAEQVFTTLQTQAYFAVDFQEQFEVMKTKLDRIKALLADTENLKTKKQIVKATLASLRDLVFEADNILTDCLLRSDYQKDGSCTTLSFQKPIFCYQTGKKLKQINAKMEMMEQSLGANLKAQDLNEQDNNSYHVLKYTSQYYDPSEIIGLESDLEKLKGWIFGTTNKLHRIGITGMGGLGKTTIAQKIFNDKIVINHFEKMLWVSVSRTSSAERIMRSMLEQLDPSSLIWDEAQMLHKISVILKDINNCLIVMDDVWEMNEPWWNKFCSCLQNSIGKQSCIIVTTRNEEVAMGTMGVHKSEIHQPKPLNKQESWLLFSKFAFSRCRGKCPPDDRFEIVGKQILEKCGGLPLAIKTIAALLAPKTNSLVQWTEIKNNFHELTVGGQIEMVTASLQLSYDELPTHLKQCLLCFSIYPEDFEIHAEQLIHWWIGEGLIQGKGSKTAKEVGFEYLSDLVTRCLVGAVQRRDYDGRVYSCKMHDMVRELTTKIAEEESFGSFDEHSRQKLTGDPRWLGFTREMNTEPLRKSSRFRALLVMPRNEVTLGRNILCLTSLRVLDLSLNQMENVSVDDLLVWICSLKRLACLNLSGVPGLTQLPNVVRNLRNLQILILNGCNNLVKLNPSIISLRKLVILDLGSCGLQFLPKGIERLTHLQELSGFRVTNQGNRQSCRFDELKVLINLRVLRMNIGEDSEISGIERDVLSKLEKLKVLSIDTENCEDEKISEMLNGLSPPSNLQELYLRRYRRESLPSWMNPEMLSSLRYLCLENGDLVQIEAGENVSTWNIEGLCFKVLPNLRVDWKNLKKEMPFLRYAEVSGCFNLKNFPPSRDKLVVWRKGEEFILD
ncbi:Disease resistance RPP13-like protein 4 [Euphorbia peplus]|nr:Disease resistance RPP13-like protein 4 [Euphorbia peplus]